MKYLLLLLLTSCRETIYIPNSQLDDECKTRRTTECGYNLYNCLSNRSYACEKVVIEIEGEER